MANDLTVLDKLREYYGLDERRIALLKSFVNRGSIRAAARAAGMSMAEANEIICGDPAFMAAMDEYMQGVWARDRIRARRIVVELLEKANSDNVKLKAAQLLIERADGAPVQKHVHEHKVDPEALRREIARLAAELGLAQVQVEGEVIDVEPRREKPHSRPDEYIPELPEPPADEQ